MIRRIHSLVLADLPLDRGVYRRIPVRIVGAHHEPVPPVRIPEEMEKLLAAYAASTAHSITRLAWYCLRGRASVHRRQRPHRPPVGEPGIDESGISAHRHQSTDRAAYWAAFDVWHVRHDLSAMERLIGGYVNTRLDEYLSLLG